jgi:hypothetical protein
MRGDANRGKLKFCCHKMHASSSPSQFAMSLHTGGWEVEGDIMHSMQTKVNMRTQHTDSSSSLTGHTQTIV